MYIEKDDYKAVCTDYEFGQLEADDYRCPAEASALETIASYTRHRYDIDAEFAKSGSERNAMLVQVAVNIALWLMIHRMPQKMGHDRRECLYQESIAWLKDVQSSKASPSLPTYTSEDGSEEDLRNPVKWGSQEPTSTMW